MQRRGSKIEAAKLAAKVLKMPPKINRRWVPGKRLTGYALGDASDSLFEEWVFYTRSNRSAKINSIVNFAIKNNLPWIKELRSIFAEIRGITPEEMRQQVLEGKATYLGGDPDVDDPEEE